MQFHPEVRHTAHGQTVLEHFLFDIAGLEPTWTMANVVEEQVERIRAQVGDRRVLCALSGGVDSAVAAALVQRAIGDRLTCVFVDHGLLREGEAEQVERDFVAVTGVGPAGRRRARAVPRRAGRGQPTPRRSGRSSAASSSGSSSRPRATSSPTPRRTARRSTSSCRARSTPTSSSPAAAPGRRTSRATTTSAGCPRTCSSPWSSRCARCSRTRCARSACSSGLPEALVWRQPFPGPGLGIRIVGEVTRERLDMLRQADAIARAELTAAGLDREIWQCPVVLLADVRSVGVQGDGRTYGHPVVLRPVSSEDAMTADWTRLPYDVLARISTRITNEVPEVNRVVLDVTSKPPGTIEWE